MFEAFLDRLLGHRLEPEALDRLGATGELDDVVENQFSLAAGVAGVDDLGNLGIFEEFFDHFEAVGGSGNRLKLKGLGDDWESVELPGETLASGHFVGKAELHQMTHRRGDDIIVDFEEFCASGFPSEGSGQVGGDAWLLGNDEGFGH